MFSKSKIQSLIYHLVPVSLFSNPLETAYEFLYGMNAKKINYPKGAELLTRAVEEKAEHAASLLGWCYAYGIGVEVDEARAVKLWLSEPDCMYSQKELAWCYRNNHYGVTRDMKQYDALMAKALPALENAAKQGSARAQYNLAYCHQHAFGYRENNTGDAIRLYHEAATQGHLDALVQYGKLVFFKEGMKATAVKAFRDAAEQNCREGQFELAWCYLRGDGVTKNKEEALKWFTLADANGDREAMRQLEKHFSVAPRTVFVDEFKMADPEDISPQNVLR